MSACEHVHTSVCFDEAQYTQHTSVLVHLSVLVTALCGESSVYFSKVSRQVVYVCTIIGHCCVMCVVYDGEVSPYYDIAYLYAEVIQKCVCMPIYTV